MRALILVDIQNDFCPGGALAVPEGDVVVPVANTLMNQVEIVVATQDWHPVHHGSFAAHHPGRQPFDLGELAGLPQVLWPLHCVQGTEGARFHPELDRKRIMRIFPKGMDASIDSYSGFFDNGRLHSTGMGEWLTEQGVTEVVIVGLATDYCVKATAIDAIGFGFQVDVVLDGCRGVGMQVNDIPDAIVAMQKAGVRIIPATIANRTQNGG